MDMSCVELRGFEPLTSCMPYRSSPSPDGAERCLVCHCAAKTLARCGLMSPGACRHWLPSWLPANSLATLTVPWPNNRPARQTARGASSRTPADDRTGEDPPLDDVRIPCAAQPDPAPGAHTRRSPGSRLRSPSLRQWRQIARMSIGRPPMAHSADHPSNQRQTAHPTSGRSPII
jgi:hypothetical protein